MVHNFIAEHKRAETQMWIYFSRSRQWKNPEKILHSLLFFTTLEIFVQDTAPSMSESCEEDPSVF
jgi:hypothetical protein